ncbi:thioredoxin [Brevibacillus fluminis]|uniref:Thioredoxin n=1 Tax=Brevibacillus fluminis TaxID=511487 RepID=A0A3M8DR60_9BACL|nr:thioredoxin family protein [Brevibacillus fluminis]RNB90626.1 thioredoxin [Brevibacillus fluminis]
MKKLVIFLVAIVLVFIGGMVYSDYSNKQAAQGNPYGKETLNPATVAQLNDPLYDNQIVPDALKERLAKKEDTYVYFYSPLCEHCERTTPILVPVTKELGIDMKKNNVLEFDQSWDDYKITGTPTLIHFKDGKEVDRIEGEYAADDFKKWFEMTAKK